MLPPTFNSTAGVLRASHRCLHNVTFHLFILPSSALQPNYAVGEGGWTRAQSGSSPEPIGCERWLALRLLEHSPPAPQASKLVCVSAGGGGGEEGNLPPFFNNFLLCS